MYRHETDPLAFGVGILFLVIGGGYLLGELTDNQIEARWVLPVALLAVGLAGLLVSMVEIARRRGNEPSAPPATDEEDARRP